MAAKPGIRLSPQFDQALQFAIAKHEGQYRKGNRAPYISHPLAVASLALECGATETQAIAALLHDVIEDCEVTPEEIEEKFGKEVCEIVVACTERLDKDADPWRTRKQDYLLQLETVPPVVALVVICDKFHNLTSLVHDIRFRGEIAWTIFKASPDDVRWYYRELGKLFRKREAIFLGRSGGLLAEFERLIALLE